MNPMSPETKTGLMAFGIVGGLFLVGGLVVGAVLLGRSAVSDGGPSAGGLLSSPPRAERQGQDWNHAELLDHLKRAGVPVTKSSLIPNTPNAVYYAGKGAPNLVLVTQHPTPKAAHDAAGKGDFDWGRFVFYGDPETVALIRAALR